MNDLERASTHIHDKISSLKHLLDLSGATWYRVPPESFHPKSLSLFGVLTYWMINLQFLNVAATLWCGELLHWFLPCFNTLLQAGQRTTYWVTPKQVTCTHLKMYFDLLMPWFQTCIKPRNKKETYLGGNSTIQTHKEKNLLNTRFFSLHVFTRRKDNLAPPPFHYSTV